MVLVYHWTNRKRIGISRTIKVNNTKSIRTTETKYGVKEQNPKSLEYLVYVFFYNCITIGECFFGHVRGGS